MGADLRDIAFFLNGQRVEARVATHETLVDLLHRFGLGGARESCGQGLCGCCTVLVDETPVSGCLSLAALVDGKSLTTIEGLDQNGELDVVQQAFIDEGAFQCGFCTPGFILMTRALLRANATPSDEEIRDHLAGNLCRCAAYPEIIRATKTAAERMRGTTTA